MAVETAHQPSCVCPLLLRCARRLQPASCYRAHPLDATCPTDHRGLPCRIVLSDSQRSRGKYGLDLHRIETISEALPSDPIRTVRRSRTIPQAPVQMETVTTGQCVSQSLSNDRAERCPAHWTTLAVRRPAWRLPWASGWRMDPSARY